MSNTWILVADTEGARFYESRSDASETRLLRDLPHHAQQAMAFALSEPAEEIEQRFARELAWLLGRARSARSFQRLVLVAPPPLLGRIRAELDPPTRALVSRQPPPAMRIADTASLRRSLATALPS